MSYTNVISVAELAALIDDPQTVVVDCRFALADPELGQRQYNEGHLPGAVYADLDRDLSSSPTATSGRHPLPDAMKLAGTLASWGIDPTKQVVAYDASGSAFAARFWWLTRWLGLENVAVLDGGIAAWQGAGHELTAELPSLVPSTFAATPNRNMWLSTSELQAGLEAGQLTLVDARAPARYQGEEEPIDPVAGHVPGALNLPQSQNLNEAAEFRSPSDLAERFEPVLGDRHPTQVVHMCGSGVTACVNLLAGELAGYQGMKLYPGSWSEWIRDPERGVATGS